MKKKTQNVEQHVESFEEIKNEKKLFFMEINIYVNEDRAVCVCVSI